MKTPRSWSSWRTRSASVLGPLLRRPRSVITPHFPPSPGPRRLAEQRGARILPVERLGELLDRLTLLVGELLRDVDPDPVVDVAPARALGTRRSLAAQALYRAVLGARRDADRLRAAQRRHLDARALNRLRHGHREVHLEVAVGPLPEDRRGSDPGGHVEVSARASAIAGLALSRKTDPAAIVDARGDVDPVALGLLADPAAAAGRAGIVDHAALAPAFGARLRDREEALALGVDAGSLAARADVR